MTKTATPTTIDENIERMRTSMNTLRDTHTKGTHLFYVPNGMVFCIHCAGASLSCAIAVYNPERGALIETGGPDGVATYMTAEEEADYLADIATMDLPPCVCI